MMTRAELVEYEFELREQYLDILEAILNPQMPRLANTDGEPWEPITLEYELRCSVESAVDRLKALAGGETEAEVLQHADRDTAGNLQSVEIPWLKRDNQSQKAWETTLLATLKVTPGRITAEVNSVGRATRLKDEVRERLGSDAVLVNETVHDIEDERAASDPRASMSPEDEVEVTPEIESMLRELQAKQWENWVDEEIPALGNATPRAAAQTAQGRERLEALFAEYAWQNDRLPSASRVDIDDLRRRLGMALT
jgi:hypothetical protein